MKLLLILIFLLFPLGEVFRIDIGNNVILKPLDLVVVLTALSFFVAQVLKNKKLPRTELTKPVFIFSAIAILSLVVNISRLTTGQFIVSFLYWFRFVCYAAIYFVILTLDKKFIKKITFLIFIDGFIILVLGFIQYLLYPNLRNLYYLGWDEHNYRLFSSFLDPNFAGAFFVLFLLFIFGLIHGRAKIVNNRSRNLLSIVALATFIAILLTYSRSAILMLATGLITYLLLIGKKKYILISLIVFCGGLILLLPTFNKENTNLMRVTSSMARLETYKNAITIIKSNPVFGVGFNAYRYAQQAYGFRKLDTQFESHADSGVDSSILFVTATTGIVGLAAYVYLWYKIIERAIIQRRSGNIYSNVIIASVVGLFVNSIFINSLFFPIFILWMWILIALMEKEQVIQR